MVKPPLPRFPLLGEGGGVGRVRGGQEPKRENDARAGWIVNDFTL